jgi:multidrug resistance efflux pump
VRTLQPLRQIRAPRARQVERIERDEHRSIARDMRGVRGALFKRALLVVPVVGVFAAWAGGAFSPRTVEGLVEADWVVSRAPARARVAELFVERGELVRAGQPLLRLEALDATQLDVAVAEVEQRRLRLAIAESGGETGGVDLGRRVDLAERAEIEFRMAESELAAHTAEVETLVRERAAADAELAREQARLATSLAALQQRIAGARATSAAATEEHRLASLDADSAQALHADGIAPARKVDSAASKQSHTGHLRDAAESRLRALVAESEGLQRELDLESRRRAARLDELDARLEQAREELDGSRTRRDLWSALTSSRRELLPAEPTAGRDLRALELEFLRSELSEAEARLEAAERAAGNMVVVAECDGVVEGLRVQAGSAVEPEAELVRYYDPTRLTITAYAEPAQADWLREGLACTVTPEGADEELGATVVWSGAAWVPCPPQLAATAGGQGGLRVPIALSCSARDGLRPNMRVRIEVPRTDEPRAERGS